MSAIAQTVIRPFYARISVVPSPVDESQRPSGLIVPWGEDKLHLNRGVVVAIDQSSWLPTTDLREGMVVWYAASVRCGDVVLVEAEDIWAFEEGD